MLILRRLKIKTKPTDRLQLAFFILNYGSYDGAHHKQWVLDQILRKLFSEKYYIRLVKAHRMCDEGCSDCIDNNYCEDSYLPWDEGVTP